MWSLIRCPDNGQSTLLNLNEVLLSANLSGNVNLCKRCVINCSGSLYKTLGLKTAGTLPNVKDEHPLAYILSGPVHTENAKDLFDRSCLLQPVISKNRVVGSLEYNNPTSINNLIESMSGMWTDQFIPKERKLCWIYMLGVRNRSAVINDGYQATVNSCINLLKDWLYNPDESKDVNDRMGIDKDKEREHQKEMIVHLENILPMMLDQTFMSLYNMPLYINSIFLRGSKPI